MSDAHSHAAGASPSKALPRSRRLRWWAVSVVLLVVACLAFLPQLLGSKWLYQKLVDRMAVEGFRLQIDRAELGWFRPIALRGIRIEQLDAPKSEVASPPNRKPVDLISIEAIESNRSLLGYLVYGRDLGQVTFLRPKVDIQLLENTSNLEKLARSIEDSQLKPAPGSTKTPPQVDVRVSIVELSVSVTSPEESSVNSSDSQTLLVVPPLNVNATYLARDGKSRLVIEPSTLLHEVEITQDLVRLGLGRAIPLLAKSAWFDGKVSLHVDSTEIPLDHPELAEGRAQLTLHRVRSGPSEPVILNVLDMIARFRQKESEHELVFVDGSIIQLQAKDGKLEHRGVQVGLPKIDPRLQMSSSGSVGLLDRALDLGVGIPVPLELLARRESVQSIGIPQMTLPIRGTLDSPVVDWKALRHDSADLLSLISAALGEEAPGTAAAMDALSGLSEGKADQAIGAAIDVIKELRLRRQERRQQSGQPTTPVVPIDQRQDAPESSAPAGRRPLRDALKGLLRGDNGGS
jgi:hypothetical protein